MKDKGKEKKNSDRAAWVTVVPVLHNSQLVISEINDNDGLEHNTD